MNALRLKQEKQLLIRQCEVDRQKLYDCFEELEEKTSWMQLAIAGATIAAPKMKLLIPVIGFLLPKLLSSNAAKGASGSFRQTLSVASGIAQKVVAVSKGLKLIPQFLPRR